MSPLKTQILKGGLLILCLALAACNDDSGSGQGHAGTGSIPEPEQGRCAVKLDSTSIRAAAVSAAQMQDACGLSKEEFLRSTQKFN